MTPRCLLAIALAFALSSCATFNRGSGAEQREAQEAAIEKVLQDQVQAWNRGDLEAFMDGYWPSPALVFTSSGRVQRGWQMTLDRYRAIYGESPETMGRLSFSDLEVHPLGPESAWVLGKWALTANGAGRSGVFTLVFQRLGRVWRIVHDHTSETEQE